MCYSALVKQDLKYLEKKFGSFTIREQFDAYQNISEEYSKLYHRISSRIFPGNFSAVVLKSHDKLVNIPMRYGTFPEMDPKVARKYTSYNVRSDNIESPFWSNAFLKFHGFLVIEKFFEWVEVKDLIKAGIVSLEDVKSEFDRQIDLRRQKATAESLPFKFSPSEKKPPIERKIVIEFYPVDEDSLIVPIIANMEKFGNVLKQGFAIVTTSPSADILQAGHDRSPIFIPENLLNSWLVDESSRKEKYLDLLITLSHDNKNVRWAQLQQASQGNSDVGIVV
jgi:putative SOS response-associated peptidase YedK